MVEFPFFFFFDPTRFGATSVCLDKKKADRFNNTRIFFVAYLRKWAIPRRRNDILVSGVRRDTRAHPFFVSWLALPLSIAWLFFFLHFLVVTKFRNKNRFAAFLGSFKKKKKKRKDEAGNGDPSLIFVFLSLEPRATAASFFLYLTRVNGQANLCRTERSENFWETRKKGDRNAPRRDRPSSCSTARAATLFFLPFFSYSPRVSFRIYGSSPLREPNGNKNIFRG